MVFVNLSSAPSNGARGICLAQTINIRPLRGKTCSATNGIKTPGRVRFQPKSCLKKPRTYEIATQKPRRENTKRTIKSCIAAQAHSQQLRRGKKFNLRCASLVQEPNS